MILVDEGFQIKNECNERNIQLNIPAGLREQLLMTNVLSDGTKHVATLRILVEQALGRLRRFKILNNISVTEIPSLRKIISVCAESATWWNQFIKIKIWYHSLFFFLFSLHCMEERNINMSVSKIFIEVWKIYNHRRKWHNIYIYIYIYIKLIILFYIYIYIYIYI